MIFCDVITPDLQKVGGLAEGRKIADMAAAANKPFAPHMIGGPLALMASAHLAVSIPNLLVCEFHAHDVPFFHELAAGRYGGVVPPRLGPTTRPPRFRGRDRRSTRPTIPGRGDPLVRRAVVRVAIGTPAAGLTATSQREPESPAPAPDSAPASTGLSR